MPAVVQSVGLIGVQHFIACAKCLNFGTGVFIGSFDSSEKCLKLVETQSGATGLLQ